MANKNTSDSIEAYIKALLAQAGMAELKRSELADVFQVVPSQINYVIKTRFTESRGYIVESKRGGGWLYPHWQGPVFRSPSDAPRLGSQYWRDHQPAGLQ